METEKKFSVRWKYNQKKKKGGWAQKHEEIWKWHYIESDTEYSTGKYFTKKDCEENNKKD